MKRTKVELQHIRESVVKIAVNFCNLSRQILHYANLGTPRADFLSKISLMLLDFSNCDEVEWRVKDGELHYRWESNQSNGGRQFCEKLSPVQRFGKDTIPCLDNDSIKERLCRAVMCRDLEHSPKCISLGGSFWTNTHEEALNYPSTFDSLTPDEVRTLTDGYQSVVYLPFGIDKDNHCLLILKNRQRDFFTKSMIEFYEGLVKTLGAAISDRRAQYNLRERIKELKCLYGINELAQNNPSLDDLLQGIVELMPPAWQYPDIASARLFVDEQVYVSQNFEGGEFSLRAEIRHGEKRKGFVELVYKSEQDDLEATIFLEEERHLIDNIARHISLMLERRQAEQEKHNLEEQLRHADRLAAIGQLGAGVAHELNEPLTAILGFAQLIRKTPDLPAEIDSDVEHIVNSSLHAREIVKKLLIFSRQMPTTMTDVDLTRVVQDGLYFLESRCKKQGIKVIRRLTTGLPMIDADPSQLQQVLVNLIVNANHAMADGGKLTISTYSDSDHVYLDVSDTGVGMSEETIRKVFIPFFTTKDVGQGTGLGLSVVHGIVTSFGGHIDVKSEPGKGSSFIIAFPIPAERCVASQD
ncbi:hypothetical protein K8R78_06395 [bacterium]|nr:hypothetical protein [bacterium]